MVARIALRPFLRVLNRARRMRSWEELKSLLVDRIFPVRTSGSKDPNPLPPRLFQMATGYWISQAIYVAAKLGIADLLEDGPQSSAILAAATQLDAPSLYRLLRALSSIGVLSQVDGDRFSLSRLGSPLRSNVPGSLRAIVITIGEIHYQACGELLHSVQTGAPVFNQAFGTNLFEYLQQNTEAAGAFNRGMTNLACLLAHAVVLAYDFSGIASIVDVGGGEGELLMKILELYPETSGIVFDLSNTFGSPKRNVTSAERCSYVAGNFFDSVPEKADAYLLCGVIHDWSDDRAVVILKNCRKAMAQNGRVLILEMIVPTARSASFSKILDLNMMVMNGGRERTKSEFHALLAAADLRVTRIVSTLAPQSIIEAIPK
jgi:O-methyltransferase domain/Dimerisation domain